MRQISRNVNWHCLGKYISQISAILFKNIFKEYFPCIFPRICTPGQICPIFFLSSDWQFQIFFMLKQNELQHIFSWMLLFWRIIIQWNLTFTFVLVWCLEIKKFNFLMSCPWWFPSFGILQRVQNIQWNAWITTIEGLKLKNCHCRLHSIKSISHAPVQNLWPFACPITQATKSNGFDLVDH